MVILFAVTIFTGAALLFVVQPMFARMLLPFLGGSPAVWNTALVFYQTVLLAGYAYAHVTTRWLGVRRQVWLHLVLLLTPLLALPIAIPHGWLPATETNPIPSLLLAMALAVGLPFFVVAATSPLLQRWFAASGHRLAADPYFLYSASNLGSLLALAGYPILIEPNLGLVRQSRSWTIGYFVLIALVAACGLWIRRVAVNVPGTTAEPVALTWRRQFRWLVLALVPSSLMMSVTTYMTSEIAPVPLLWVIPLGGYLLTFVIVFARRNPISHTAMVRLLPVVVLGVLWNIVRILMGQPAETIDWLILLHLFGLFVVAMVCHGELANDRPPASQLTEFYLLISAGGVLGGMFNALLAPVIFPSVFEYPVTLILACALLPGLRNWKGDIAWPALLGLITAGLIVFAYRANIAATEWGTVLGFVVPALVCLTFYRRPVRLALGVAVVFTAMVISTWVGSHRVFRARSFFGIHQVIVADNFHYLHHGSTTHGIQNFDSAHRREPLAYYSRTGPLGEVIAALPAALKQNVAVIGLGAGTAACYGQAGQQWTFYEIDPVVERIARDPRYFTFLADSPAENRVVLGDARLSLQQAPDHRYGLLILDAYNSDSLPLHLITREALALYLQKLAPDGVLAFHISARHLDLKSVLTNLAHDAGLASLYLHDFAGAEIAAGKCSSHWLVMARQPATLQVLANTGYWRALRPQPAVGIWTDDYASLFRVWSWE